MRPYHLPLILCSCVSLLLAEVAVQAQATNNDASDSFVNAYSECQKAEKLEATGNLRSALQTYKEAAHLLDGIAQHWPNWNPSIVEYRRKRTSEAISKLSGKVGSDNSAPQDEQPSVFPPVTDPGVRSGGIIDPVLPSDPIVPVPDQKRTSPSHTRTPPAPVAGGNPIKEIQDRMDALERENAQQAAAMEKLRQDNADLSKQLKDAAKAQKEAEEKGHILEERANLVESKLSEALKGNKTTSTKVKDLQAQYDKAHADVRDLKIQRDAAEEVRVEIAARLETSEKKAQALQKERDAAVAESGKAAAEIAAVQKKADKQVAEAQEKLDGAVKEREATQGKLAAVTKERDDALQQVVKMKEAQKQVDKLVTDNAHLMAQLADAEKQISQFKADGLQKDEVIVGLKKEVSTVQQQLNEAKKQSSDYQTHMGEIQAKLEATAADLSSAKNDGVTNAAERKKMQEENDVLRGIVMREMKEQARRDQTRKLVLVSMAKLGDKSGDLLKQISYLSQPVVKLSSKERSLFKKPQVEIGDNEISLGTPKEDTPDPAPAPGATDSAPAVAETKPAGNSPVPELAAAAPAAPEIATPPVADAKPEAPPEPKPALVKEDKPAPPAESKPALSLDQPASESLGGLPNSTPPVTALASLQKAPDRHGKTASDSGDLPKKSDDAPGDATSGGKGASSTLPPEMLPVMQQAKDEFERANYRDSEKLYEKVLAQAPTNLNALDNLGVVRFRSGKLKLAEEAFRKAIAIAPEDAFSHCTLGIVYYSSQKYDEAVNELTKALAINPKNATAHNYLGITASQKGWQEAAQKELETATALDPSYADAQFNLAVVFGTQQPPNKESARKYYRRAIELGAEPDSSLEQLLK